MNGHDICADITRQTQLFARLSPYAPQIAILCDLMAERVNNLKAGGYNPHNAAVSREDWRKSVQQQLHQQVTLDTERLLKQHDIIDNIGFSFLVPKKNLMTAQLYQLAKQKNGVPA